MALKEQAKAYQDKLSEIKTFWDGVGDADLNEEQKQSIDKLNKEAEELGNKVVESKEYQAIREKQDAIGASIGQPQGRPEYGTTDARNQKQEYQSPASEFVNNDQFKGWLRDIAPHGGRVADGIKIQSPAVELKSLVLTSNTSGGAMVRRDYYPNVELPLRPLTIRDVITTLRTTSNLIEYVRVTALTRAAAITPEATATSSTGYSNAAKPEAGMTMEIEQAGVKTIPVWMPITRQIFEDVPYLESLIEAFLRQDIELALEEEVISGAGGSSHFLGLDNTPGLTPQAFDTDLLTTTRKARTKVRTIGRANPTGYLLNPYDWQTLDLTTAPGSGVFYFGGPMQMGTKMLWGLPVIESEVVPQGTGYVGDLKQMVLWDRSAATVRVSDSHSDFFTHNVLAILAELRAAFGVLRPAAIVDMDLFAGRNS